VAAHSKHADPVRKISIIPRGRAALGYTLQLPADDRFLMTASQLRDRIRYMLGGRAAEEVVFGEVTTGAENDLEHATALARQMVCVFGMSPRVGLARCANRQNGMFNSTVDGSVTRDCSEQTAEQVDQEVKSMLDGAYSEAKRIHLDHRKDLDAVARELLERETLDGESFLRLIGLSGQSPPANIPGIEASPETLTKI
jgi:cell division protease FtsH